MTNGKGTCETHGEFDLMGGCPGCLSQRRDVGIRPEQDEMEDGLNGEGLTLKADKPTDYSLKNESNGHHETLMSSTTLVLVKPDTDSEVMAFYSTAKSLEFLANARVILSPGDLEDATNDLSIISTTKKDMEAKRKEYLRPFKEHIDEVNEIFKGLMEPIVEADTVTRGKMEGFVLEQARIRAKQEEVNRLRSLAAEKEMALKGELSESVNLVEVMPEQAKTVHAAMGSAGMTDSWKYEVFDFGLLPDEYKVADTAMLTAIARKQHDNKQIPGVRFYNEPHITMRTR